MEEMNCDPEELENTPEPESTPEPQPAPEEEAAPKTVPQEEEQPKKKSGRTLKIVLTVTICVVLLAVMLVALLLGTDIPALREAKLWTSQKLGIATELTQEKEPAATEPQISEPEVTLPENVKSYTVDEATGKQKADDVVATAGTAQLTNAELQICYQMAFSNFVNQNMYYLSYIGLDLSMPLDQQLYPNTDMTWQQVMVDNGISVWHQVNAVRLVAEAEGYELDALGKKYLDVEFANMLEQLGYSDMDTMLKAQISPIATEAAYRNYMFANYYAVEYLDEKTEPTLEQIEAYYMGKQEDYTASGVTKEDATQVVDIRHVLIMPEGGTVDETTGETVYSEEEWEACRQKAQALLDQWRSGEATEDAFAMLAMDHSEDGNASQGGIYEGVSEGQMVETFNDWIFDESRQYGDSDLVKTPYGYHIMFFVKREPLWVAQARSDFQMEKMKELIEQAMAQYPLEINDEAIVIIEVAE